MAAILNLRLLFISRIRSDCPIVLLRPKHSCRSWNRVGFKIFGQVTSTSDFFQFFSRYILDYYPLMSMSRISGDYSIVLYIEGSTLWLADVVQNKIGRRVGW
jgi:hypothetical protein